MNEITLSFSTGEAKVDAILRGTIGILEMVFPQRIRAYYLAGSYVDGSYIPASDLDVVPVFKAQMLEGEEAIYWQVIHNLNLLSPIHLGFGLRNEADSFTQGGVGIKIGSELLYGEDIRDSIPLWSLDYYLQYMIGAHLGMMLSFRGNTAPLVFPLSYPDPDDEFYGYVQSGDEPGKPETSALFGHVMVMASTLVTLKTGAYNASKSRSHTFYSQHIKDKWNSLLDAFYEPCKLTWHYRIPPDADDRQILRTLCGQIPAFENHFLEQIKPYLQKQRDSGSQWGIEQAGRIVFPNGADDTG
jgi:hypothetical protein